MSGGLGKCSKIRHIVRLRQILRRWRCKASSSAAASDCIPSDVPAGHIAVCVGSSSRRFVVRATHLNHPVFKELLSEAEEEYGFANQPGPLAIPCDELVFEEVLQFVSRPDSGSARFTAADDFRRCSAPARGPDWWPESRPLLYDKSVC